MRQSFLPSFSMNTSSDFPASLAQSCAAGAGEGIRTGPLIICILQRNPLQQVSGRISPPTKPPTQLDYVTGQGPGKWGWGCHMIGWRRHSPVAKPGTLSMSILPLPFPSRGHGSTNGILHAHCPTVSQTRTHHTSLDPTSPWAPASLLCLVPSSPPTRLPRCPSETHSRGSHLSASKLGGSVKSQLLSSIDRDFHRLPATCFFWPAASAFHPPQPRGLLLPQALRFFRLCSRRSAWLGFFKAE